MILKAFEFLGYFGMGKCYRALTVVQTHFSFPVKHWENESTLKFRVFDKKYHLGNCSVRVAITLENVVHGTSNQT